MACMDYMDPNVCCPQRLLNLITHSLLSVDLHQSCIRLSSYEMVWLYKFSGQKVTDHSKFLYRPLHICLFYGFASYLAQIQPMRLCTISRAKGQSLSHMDKLNFLPCLFLPCQLRGSVPVLSNKDSWGQSAAYAVVTSISYPYRDFKWGSH